jgi:hypothetical protein
VAGEPVLDRSLDELVSAHAGGLARLIAG